jgi:hypothetical protein
MRVVAPETQTTQRYASAVGELWSGLARTLARLDSLAAEPDQLAEREALEELRLLQYRLHSASEDAAGFSPPAAARTAHGELASALADARDATGELAEVIGSEGADAVGATLYEWRGALFRVRLARLRLGEPVREPEPPAPEEQSLVAPVAALALTVGGAAAFLIGATFGPWPLWAFGAVAICSSLLVYRP